eukprot:364709-Chlamydomonas_euryale.AAC.14
MNPKVDSKLRRSQVRAECAGTCVRHMTAPLGGWHMLRLSALPSQSNASRAHRGRMALCCKGPPCATRTARRPAACAARRPAHRFRSPLSFGASLDTSKSAPGAQPCAPPRPLPPPPPSALAAAPERACDACASCRMASGSRNSGGPSTWQGAWKDFTSCCA